MKFAHLSDCHIGGWRQEEMKEVSIESFKKAMDICIEREIDFIIISRDLFDTSLPSITALKQTTTALKKVKDHIVGKLMLGLETSDSVASFFGMQEILAKEIMTPTELADKIQKVTAKEIKEVAKDIFKNEKLNLAVIGPAHDEKNLKEALKIA